MKWKVRSFEEKLKKTIEEKEDMEMSKLEFVLLDRIVKGQFDNKKCKKGRKRNQNEFFSKNLLEEFIVKEEMLFS